MKIAILSASLCFTSFAHAGTMRLHALDCRAVNGGRLEATRENGAALMVEASFGFSQKEYIGRIGELSQDGPSRFILLNKDGGVELEVKATIDPEVYGVQRVAASIGFAGFPLMAVAATCDIQVNPYRN